MIDNELFELCKEVYKRFPEWNDTENVWSLQPTGTMEEQLAKEHIGGFEDEYVPAKCLPMGQKALAPYYTSDYLLEKLPKDLVDDEHEVHAITLYCGKWTKQWLAGYEGYFGGQNDPSDTPLKALLKLIIALDDAGVKI